MTEAVRTGLTSTVWSKCWEERLCVDYLGCTPYVKACIKIVEKGSQYFIQLSILGETVEYELASLCYPVYSIGIGRLEACTRDLSIDTKSQRLSFNLFVKLCIGKWKIEKCWKLSEERVSISWLTYAEVRAVDPDFVLDEDLYGKREGKDISYDDYKVYLGNNAANYE